MACTSDRQRQNKARLNEQEMVKAKMIFCLKCGDHFEIIEDLSAHVEANLNCKTKPNLQFLSRQERKQTETESSKEENARDIFRKSLNISSKVNLEDELKNLEKIVTLTCENCSFTTKTLHCMKIHMKMKHENKETIICDICGFKTSNFGLLQHVKMMHEIRFKCPYCELEYPHEYRLEYHIEASHPGTSELKHFCSECGDGFMFEKNMIKHSEKHKKIDDISDGKNANEKVLGDNGNAEVQKPDKINHLCSKCGKYFTSLIDLAHHFFKEHNKLGEDFDCPMCPKMISASVKSSVMDHIRSTHLNETKKCPDCKQTYKLLSYKQHRQKVHGVRYHLKRKPVPIPTSAGYECPDCKKVLLTKGSKYILRLPFNYLHDTQNVNFAVIFFLELLRLLTYKEKTH